MVTTVKDIASSTPKVLKNERLIDVKQLAEELGVPTSWVYSRTRERGPDTIPCLRLGKYRRFRLSEVMAWLEQQSALQNNS